jgi:N6-L-threonylcarbamoyladenine synthase
MIVLGIETSCDETAAAVVEDGQTLLSNVVASSVDLHIAYGGVVPEIAARSHIESITPVIEQALSDAKTDWDGIDAIGVTYGPGLGGSLLIGVMTARTLAIAKNKPLYAVNHVEAHVYAAFIEHKPKFPILALIVSGGHTQLVLFTDHFKYKILGQTADDAIGEAFDKVAKMLGLPYPGGPSVSECAKNGDSTSVKLPKARMTNRLDFSFSGLKTAVLRAAQELAGKDYTLPSSHLPELLNASQKADLAASFQRVALETVVEALQEAIEQYSPASVVVAGGVAASTELRRMLTEAITLPLLIPEFKLCTDNAAMIAANAYFQASHRKPVADPYKLGIDPGLSM